MFEMIVTAILAGQLITAQHEFGQRGTCLEDGAIIWHQLNKMGATDISIHCYEEPAT